MSLYIKVKQQDGSIFIAESTTVIPTNWQYDPNKVCDGTPGGDSDSICIQLTDDPTGGGNETWLFLSIPFAHANNPTCMWDDNAGTDGDCNLPTGDTDEYWNKAVGDVIYDALQREDKAAHISVMSDECTCVYGPDYVPAPGEPDCAEIVTEGGEIQVLYYNHIFADVSIGTLSP